ncbi:MAG: hypothetical protein KJO07_05215, partial [Deltaproteobacteria bacterium]|nr:hypothetical protein [Deltaproteobacteria bacterium]
FPTEQELADHALSEGGIEEALDELVEMAKERGGHDNITGVLVKIVSAPKVEDVDDDGDDDDDEDAVPTEIARDDTVPVDVDELIAKEEAKKRELALATTGEIETVDPEGPTGEFETTSDDDDSDDDAGNDSDDDEGAADSEEPEVSIKQRLKADLKTTIPIRPLKAPDKSAKQKSEKKKKD